MYKTEQENFWAGEFGTQYVARNSDVNHATISANTTIFAKILSKTGSIQSLIEFGSNIGLNLSAIQWLLPQLNDISAVEINETAVQELRKRVNCTHIYQQSILDFACDYPRDLVLIKGVMIHLNPECLPSVYDTLYQTSKRYICIAEYYNPTPVEVLYRGNEGKLFKRDFAGELMDRHQDLALVDYGFQYHRDRCFPLDDITWFLLEKR